SVGRRTPPPDAAHRARDAHDNVVLTPSLDALALSPHIPTISSLQHRIANPALQRHHSGVRADGRRRVAKCAEAREGLRCNRFASFAAGPLLPSAGRLGALIRSWPTRFKTANAQRPERS